MISVATWNVLHRIHADNWAEPVARHWPDEAARIEAITARLAARDDRVIALQEVSGDQLASLRALSRTVIAFRYPRVPRPRHVSTLADPAEYLVTLVDGPAREVAAEASATDPGKGLLAVEVDGVVVVNTHVTYGDPRVPQLARLAAVARAAPGAAIVLGDFNADRAAVATIGDDFVLATPAEPALPTRPRTGSTKSSTIDHVLARRATPHAAAVIDAGGQSDHNLVVAAIAMILLAGCGACTSGKLEEDPIIPCDEEPEHEGEGTYYDADGSGACGFDPSPDDLLVAAINDPDYDGSAPCGACAQIDGPDGSVTVRIVDRCPGCAAGDLDLSREAFEVIAPLAAGRVPITWRFVACDVTGPLRYHFKDGSNPFWTAIQLRNHRHAIARLEAKVGDTYQPIAREDYNYFVAASGLGDGPLALRVTDTHGYVVEDVAIAPGDDVDVDSASQLPACD